ncbi:ABC transporter substrate-binding protein [Halopiger goleimassiliensis]|uniref:ABC transporter substrate-binding protein n=1 Tax=Halopiger goleimassiliensis TaxID=1293048 RepID=UPI0006782D15|nr:ABC transporter substrate-binding protein [Halopiger goleimassiliensis]
MRTVTTLPAATETLAALGLEPVGVSHECDFPPAVEEVPSVTRSRIETDASSGEIDEQVLAAEEEGGVYDVAVETLDALDPELIVTQGMCDVCAVDDVVVERAIDEIDADPDLLTTDPHSVADVLEDVERIGRAVGREARASEVRERLEARIDRVRERTAALASGERPRVAIFDWTDPVMTAGHWTADLVSWAGGDYGLADVGDPSRPREWDEILAYDPQVVIVAPCGFGLEQTAANRSDLTEREGWDDLTAVREGRVWAMDGHHYLNRPGPRLVESLEALARILRPELREEPLPEDDVFDGFETPTPSFDEIAVPFDELDRLLETRARSDATL